MIVPVEPKVCEGVRRYFECNGQIEIERPSRCPRRKEECGSKEPMRKNGSYPRQVIYFGLLFVLSILRFRCGRCGKTVSRPFSWLVPYKRFSIEVIASGLEAYATEESKYRDLSAALSEPELLEPDRDIRQTEFYQQLSKTGEIKVAETKNKGCRPSHCTIFYFNLVGMMLQKFLRQTAPSRNFVQSRLKYWSTITMFGQSNQLVHATLTAPIPHSVIDSLSHPVL